MKRTRTIRTAPMSCEKGSMKKRRKKYQDHMKTHLVLLEFNDQEEFVPLCVAECKNAKCKNCSDLREGMAQTLSYGLSLCHKHRLTNEVFLLVISPFNWFTFVLPRYGENTTGPFVFNTYEVFTTKEKQTANGEKVTKNYLWRILYIVFFISHHVVKKRFSNIMETLIIFSVFSDPLQKNGLFSFCVMASLTDPALSSVFCCVKSNFLNTCYIEIKSKIKVN